MQEHWPLLIIVSWVGLEHSHAGADAVAAATVITLGFKLVGDKMPGRGKGTQGGWEGVLVAPTWTALGDEGVEVLRAIEVIVRCEGEGLF